MIKKSSVAALLIAVSLLGAQYSHACTHFILKGPSGSGAVVSARTVDFNIPIFPKLVSVPRGIEWESRGDGAQAPGMRWVNRYGFLGVGASNERDLYLDGINEEGLSAAILWLDEAKYMPRKGVNDLGAFDLVSYFLGSFGTLAEAKAAVQALNVYGNVLTEYAGLVAPVHLVVMDASGDSFVAEWIDGQLKLYDKGNTPGYIDVLANSPPYPGQLANVATYGNLSCYNLENYSLTGLPGNSSSTSRFARVAKLKQCAENVGGVPTGAPLIATAEEALERASVIIGRVDKVEGETITEATYGTTLSFTRLTVVRIHGRLDSNGRPTSKLYFNTPDNNALRVIDLAKLTFDDGERRIQPFYVDSPRYRRAQDAIPMPPFVDKCKGVCP